MTIKYKVAPILLSSILSITLAGCGNNERTNTEANEQNSEQQVNNETSSNEGSNIAIVEAQFITEAFDTLLNYDNSTIQERNNAINDYFTTETIENLTGYEHQHSDTSFESTVSNGNVYQNVETETNEFIYKADVGFSVKDNTATTVTNIYQFELVENNNEYRIDNVTVTTQQPNMTNQQGE